VCTVRSLPGLDVLIFVLSIGLTSFISLSGPGHFIVMLDCKMSFLLILLILSFPGMISQQAGLVGLIFDSSVN
jgi:hypothetical protein